MPPLASVKKGGVRRIPFRTTVVQVQTVLTPVLV